MMQIVYFSQKEQFLLEMKTLKGEKIFITPSPAKADALRERLSSDSYQDVITIAKFTALLAEHLWKDREHPPIKRKAELLLIFGILKNKYLPTLGFEAFNQAYNLFSDLRSFTMDVNALSSVLDEQSDEVKEAVGLFWQLLQVTGYLDEHGAYHQIAESLRSSEEISELQKTYIFWGFQHLNGQQVDLLKALSIRYNVVIPFPLSLKEKLKKGDWLSWLREFKVSEVDLPEIKIAPKAQWVSVNSREIALNLKSIIQDGDQIVLGVSKLSPSHLDIVPHQSVSYKIPHELLKDELREVDKRLQDQLRDNLQIEDLRFFLMNFKASTLKLYKVQQLYLEAMDAITEMTDEAIRVDHFFIKLLSEVVALNQPRTSYVPASREDLTIELKDMSSLEFLDRKRRVVLCLDDRFEDVQSLGQNYTESIQKALGVLGPLKRNELELLFKRWEFRDLFSQGNVILLMNEGILKHSLIWKRLFQDVELVSIERENNHAPKVIKDILKDKVTKSFSGSFSASKFQTFTDCPRKFYFSFVEKVTPQIVLQKDFDDMTMGTIVHEIIEKYFKNTEKDLDKITRQVMQSYIEEKKLKLPKETYQQRYLTFYHRAMNGVNFVLNLNDKVNDHTLWNIEAPFELYDENKITGRIDCMGVGDRFVFLLDFKSSKFSASTNTEVLNFESLQLWTYALAAKKIVPEFQNKKIVLGFVVLDDPSESNLLTDDEDFLSMIKANKICKTHHFKEGLLPLLEEAQGKMKVLASMIKDEKDFPARPRKVNACHFCEVKNVCIKSELENV